MKRFFSLFFVALVASFIVVNAQSSVVTFDDFQLPAESHTSFTDTTFVDQTTNYWTSGNFTFSTYLWSEYLFFGGTMLSNVTDTAFDANEYVEHQFRAIAGPMHANDVFAVYYGGSDTPILVNNPEGEVVNGMYITNNVWTYSAVVNGDAMTPAFAQGDYFKVMIIGEKMNVEGTDTTYTVTDTIDYYLADFRGESLMVVNTWQWIDLSGLGKINRIQFAFDGTKTNQWGLLTPTYFCYNDFNATRPVETKVNYESINVTLYPNPVTDFLYITGMEGTCNVEMHSLDGVLVYKGTMNNFGSIDVSSMTKGVYMVRVNGDKGTTVKKVIVK